MIACLRKLWQWWRDQRAARKRQELKRHVLIEDARRFFAGRETAEESRRYRDEAYKVIDEMTTDQILDL